MQKQDKYEIKTVNQYGLFEVASSFQKCVRRGYEKEAMFWATELAMSNFDNYLWKRILIITSEDIGLASPSLMAVIWGLYSSYQVIKKKKDAKHRPERLFLTHAVIALCRAKKSRLVDWTLIANWEGHQDNLLEIPDYAYDKHTLKGKKEGKGIDHFFDEASKLNNMLEIEGEAEIKEIARGYMKEPKKAVPADTSEFPMFNGDK